MLFQEYIEVKKQADTLYLESRRLKKLAFEDDLTQIGNRRKFERDYSEISSKNKPYAVLYIDLNGLKQVNDTQGHDAGSELIRLLASNLRRNCDKCYRLGGDEFTALINDIPASAVIKLVSRLEKLFQDAGCPATIGWAHSMFSKNPLQEADACMYKFKKIQKKLNA